MNYTELVGQILGLTPMIFGFGADGKAMAGQTACFAKAGLDEGTNSATIKILAPNGAGIDFAIDGIGYHKADTDNIAITAHAEQAAASKCLYLVQIDSDGLVSTKKGTAELTVDVAAGTVVLHWPDPDDNKCPIGGYKITTVGSTYTNGTTDMGSLDTFYDFAGGMPLGPRTS